MRVQFTKTNNTLSVIEVIQIIKYDTNTIGLIMPYSKCIENKNYDSYKSTKPVDNTEFNRWCEQLLRSGYMDFSRTDLVFEAAKA
ncbi:MAG: hypothetical protein J5840_03805 [Lachnospiraceae bacterium]|nr:hypothetical protein [Lachnospiraceae bacterium]